MSNCYCLPGKAGGFPLLDNDLFVLVQEDTADTLLEVRGEHIEQYSESKLLDSLVDFSDYFDKIRGRVEVDKLPDSELTLRDTYVRSHLVNEDYTPLGRNLEEFLRSWMEESSQRQIAVLGEYGQGKSTGAWMFAYHLVQDSAGHPPRVPLVIELRGKSPATLQPIELLGAWAAQRGGGRAGPDEVADRRAPDPDLRGLRRDGVGSPCPATGTDPTPLWIRVA